MDRLVERVGIGEGLVGEMMGLEIAPDGFDVVQLRSVFGQSFLSSALATDSAPVAGLSTPSQVVAAASAGEWRAIAADDLLVMDLAPDAHGAPRRVVIQLLPPPFSQGWIANIRKLAAAHWWDGLSVNRVQDNYVVQWGDVDGDNKAKAKPLPAGLVKVPEREYETNLGYCKHGQDCSADPVEYKLLQAMAPLANIQSRPDSYLVSTGFYQGWPVSMSIGSCLSG